MMKIRHSTAILLAFCATLSVGAQSQQDFALGADPSWYTQMEAEGVPFYNADGVKAHVPATLAEYGFDSIRLRLWVDPSQDMESTGGYCGLDDVTIKAKRATALGQRIMLDFHFSDSWADPGQQKIPASWSDLKTAQALADKISSYTTQVLTHLKAEGVDLAWVQIGNETSNGMLYPYGQFAINGTTSSTRVTNFIKFFNAAAASTRALYPEAKTVCHLNKGYDFGLYDWFFGEIAKNSMTMDYDYIGMSLYPIPTWGYEESDPDFYKTANWKTRTNGAIDCATKAAAKFGKRILVCEVGMPNTWSTSVQSGATAPVREAQCNADVAEFIDYLVNNMTATGVCDGFFYWEPECNYFHDYSMGALTSDYRPNAAWDYVRSISAFNGVESVAVDPSSAPSFKIDNGVVTVDNRPIADARIYTIDGRVTTTPSAGSLYIVNANGVAAKVVAH